MSDKNWSDDIRNIICYTINPESWQGTVYFFNPNDTLDATRMSYDIFDAEITDMKEANEVIQRIMKK